MVRKVIHKTIIFGGVATVLAGLMATNNLTFATSCSGGEPCSDDITFQVNIGEFISVSLTEPDNWASGDINELLRNKVTVNVTSNYAGGFQASMASKDSTDLVNTAKSTSIIETLTSSTTASAFPADHWGYSLNDNDSGSTSANYNAMQTSAIQLISKADSSTISSKDVYFGAKAGMGTDSGTYANTVVFTVVSGVVDNNETQSNTPVTPIDTNANPAPTNPVYDNTGTNNHTVYTATTQSGSGTSSVSGASTTTTTQISKGDVTSSYAPPQGVTTSSVSEGTPLATGLAITAGVAAMTGVGFFIAAKRRSDDDDDKNKQ